MMVAVAMLCVPLFSYEYTAHLLSIYLSIYVSIYLPIGSQRSLIRYIYRPTNHLPIYRITTCIQNQAGHALVQLICCILKINHHPGDSIFDLCGDGGLHILFGPLHHELHEGLLLRKGRWEESVPEIHQNLRPEPADGSLESDGSELSYHVPQALVEPFLHPALPGTGLPIPMLLLNSAILHSTLLETSTLVYHTIPYHTIPYHTILYHTMLCYIMLYYVIPRCTVLYNAVLCYTILYYTILYYTLLYSTLLYSTLYYTILYYTILYYTILYYTILYYTMLSYAILGYTVLYYAIFCCTMLYSAVLCFFFRTRKALCLSPSAPTYPNSITGGLNYRPLSLLGLCTTFCQHVRSWHLGWT